MAIVAYVRPSSIRNTSLATLHDMRKKNRFPCCNYRVSCLKYFFYSRVQIIDELWGDVQ